MIQKLPILIFVLILTFSSNIFGQTISTVTPLYSPLVESSGLTRIESKLITHNDSGGESALFEMDTLTGQTSRTVELIDATNIDWEGICVDSTYAYIGDFGNNQGERTNLKIYKIEISDFTDLSNDEVASEVIQFEYADQVDFTPSQFSTNYDAEAMVARGDSLYIFTKNWGDNWTNIYAIPKTPGMYSAQKVDSINIEGMATGATFNEQTNQIILTGYSLLLAPFIVQLSDFGDGPLSEGEISKVEIQIPSGFSTQIESITAWDSNTYYISSEESFTGGAGLFRIHLDFNTDVEERIDSENFVYPNPSGDSITISNQNRSSIKIFDSTGKFMLENNQSTFSISALPNGYYSINIYNSRGQIISVQKLIISH